MRTIVWLRPNHPQELTFATERPLSPTFVCSTPGSSPLGSSAKWAAVDPQETWALSPEFERWSLPSLRARLIKNGAKIACHGDPIRHQNFGVLLFLASLRCYLEISVKGSLARMTMIYS